MARSWGSWLGNWVGGWLGKSGGSTQPNRHFWAFIGRESRGVAQGEQMEDRTVEIATESRAAEVTEASRVASVDTENRVAVVGV